MSSQDKLAAAIVAVAVSFIVALYVADKWHEQRMAQIAADRHAKEWKLKVELEQAKTEQMRYRALELGYLCQFIDKTGEVYLSEGCE